MLYVEVYGTATSGKNLLENRNEATSAYNTPFTINIADKLKDGTLKGGTLNISFDHRNYVENVSIQYQTKDGVKTLQSNLSENNRLFTPDGIDVFGRDLFRGAQTPRS